MKRADEIDTNFDMLNESFYKFLGELGVAVESGLLDCGDVDKILPVGNSLLLKARGRVEG